MYFLRHRNILIVLGIVILAFWGGVFGVQDVQAATAILPEWNAMVSGAASPSSPNTSVTISISGGLSTSKEDVNCVQEAGGDAPFDSWYSLIGTQTSPSNAVEITSGPFTGTIPITISPGEVGTGCFDSGNRSTFSGSRSFDISSLLDGTYTVGLRVTDDLGDVGTGLVSFTIDRPVSAPTVNISADKTIVSPNGSTTLSWSTTNSPTSCTASGSWSGSKSTSGSQTVTGITGTRTYTITCSNASGSDSDSVTVRTLTANITANGSNGPITVSSGSYVTLAWSSSNAGFCDKTWLTNGFAATSGSESYGPITSSQTFTISCATSDLSAGDSDNVTVNITTSEPVSVDLKVNNTDGPVSITKGDSVTLSWTTNNANSCYSSGTDGKWTGNRAKRGGSNNVNNIDDTAQYTITCTDLNGSDSDMVEVRVPTFTVTPETASEQAPNGNEFFFGRADRDGPNWPLPSRDVSIVATWSSSNPNVVRYQGTGFGGADFLCRSGGTATITADIQDNFETGGVPLSDTSTMTCTGEADTSPTFRVSPKTASGAVGETLNFDSYYDPDGSGPEIENNWTISTSWSSADEDIVSFLGTGSFVAQFECNAVGTVTITGSAQGLSDTATVTCGPAALSCSPASQSTQPNQSVTLNAFGGTSGSYQWSAPGGIPSSGSGSSFTTRYSTLGTKSVVLTRGSESDSCTINVDTSGYIDIGLRVYDGTTIYRIAGEPQGTLTSPLRIAKDGIVYGVVLVPVSDSMATPVRVETSSGIRALRGL